MGNTPSKELHGRPVHKLSKPKVTGSQAPAPSASPSSKRPSSGLSRPSEAVQAFLSIPYSATSSNEDPAEDQQGSDKSTPLVAPKAQRRLSLFRSKSSQETPDRRKFRRNTIIGSPTASSEERFGPVVRANSVSSHHITDQSHIEPSIQENWLIAGSRASWAYDLSSYEAQRILSLVQDRPPPISRSHTSASLSGTRFDDMPRRRASMFVQPQSAPISRSNSDISLHPPMRRRSLVQTPGVATRPHPGPTPARSTRSSLRHSHPPTPSLSRQPSTHFEETVSDFLSLPPLTISTGLQGEASRVATPKDTDYSFTGAFKFGTLRITNGSPVLTPNPALCLSNDVKQAEFDRKSEDYFARDPESEGGVTSGGEVDHTLACIQSHPAAQIPDAEPACNEKSSLEVGGEETLPGLAITVPEMDLGGQCQSPLQLNLDNTALSQPSSPLMIQSKLAAVDDDLFEDDTEVSAPEILDVRVDPSARSFPRQALDSTPTSDGVNRSDSGFVSKSSKSDSSQSRSSLSKADSGYSSNVSLRSSRHGKGLATSEEEAGRNSTDSDPVSPSIQRRGSQKVLEIQVAGPATVNHDRAVVTPQSDKAPTPPPKDDFLLKQMSRAPSGSKDVRANPTMPGRMRRKPLHQRPPAVDTSQTLESQELKSPKPLPLSPASVNSDASSSSLSIGNNSQKPGRLQRLLSLRNSHPSRQPYTVHETHSVDSKIPSIPKEVEAKLRERTGLYPMTTKRLALKSQMSKETLKTILSVGSLEIADKDEPAWTTNTLECEDGEERNSLESGDVKETSLRQTFNSMQSNLKTAAVSMLSSKKPVPRKPARTPDPQERDDVQIGRQDEQPVETELPSYLSDSSSLVSKSYGPPARTLSPVARPHRSMSMTTGHDHHLQVRTHSLNSRMYSMPVDMSSSTQSRIEESQLLTERKTSPPISLATRISHRSPPPRSPSRPRGPVVPRDKRENQDTDLRTSSHPANLALAGAHGYYGSVIGGRLDKSTSASQVHMSTRNPQSRHNSISSARSDFVRESRSFQNWGQQASGAALKQQSSVEGLGQNQPYGVPVPHPAYQELKFDPQAQFDNPHGRWNTQNGRLMSGQLPWGAPPYVPRGHHRRNLSAGSHFANYAQSDGGHPPYRILHSYNSPAYRNAPIWG